MNSTAEGSTCGLLLFQYLTLYLTTKANKRIYISYIPHRLASSIWPTKRSWNLNRDPGSLYRAWGKLGISGQNINEPTYTHCCHLHLVNMELSDLSLQASWKCLATFRIHSLLFLFRQEGRSPCLFSSTLWFLLLENTVTSVPSGLEHLHRFNTLLCLKEWKGIPVPAKKHSL